MGSIVTERALLRPLRAPSGTERLRCSLHPLGDVESAEAQHAECERGQWFEVERRQVEWTADGGR